MVIHNLDFIGVAIPPRKANTPLVIDAHAVLALAITFQALQSVSRQRRERSEIGRRVEHVQFSKSLALNGLEAAYGFPVEEALGLGAAKRPDHRMMVYCFPVNVKQYGFREARVASDEFEPLGEKGKMEACVTK